MTPAKVGDVDPPEFSDDELALRVATEFGDELRYVHAWGKRLPWGGYRWSIDRTLEVPSYIILWAIEGAAEWSLTGLAPPVGVSGGAS